MGIRISVLLMWKSRLYFFFTQSGGTPLGKKSSYLKMTGELEKLLSIAPLRFWEKNNQLNNSNNNNIRNLCKSWAFNLRPIHRLVGRLTQIHPLFVGIPRHEDHSDVHFHTPKIYDCIYIKLGSALFLDHELQPPLKCLQSSDSWALHSTQCNLGCECVRWVCSCMCVLWALHN